MDKTSKLKPRIRVAKAIGLNNEICWTVKFTIGVQTFSLSERETKEAAEWYCKQLKTAFDNLLKSHNG